jgi:hypothetical protein
MSDGILNRLTKEGSILSDYDGATPPKVPDIDPGVSLQLTQLSNYKGVTPPRYIDNRPQ